MQQRLFVCENCGVDTIKQPHRHNCPVGIEEQTVLKCRELGIGYDPDKWFGKPPPYFDP